MPLNKILDTRPPQPRQQKRKGYPDELHELIETLYHAAPPTTEEGRQTLSATFRQAAGFAVENTAGKHNDYSQVFYGLHGIALKHETLRKEATETISAVYMRLDNPLLSVTRVAGEMLLLLLAQTDVEVRRAAAAGLVKVAADAGKTPGRHQEVISFPLRTRMRDEKDFVTKDLMSQALAALERSAYGPLKQAAQKLKAASPPKM